MPMQLTDSQKVEVKATFAERRRRQLFATIPGVAAVVAIGLGGDRATGTLLGLPSNVVVYGSMALVLGIVVFSFRNWRCPACDRYLGRTFNPKFCQKCGTELR